ncbi:hypothetical protein [Ramlibacter alkalitolerans]|uniref:Uncharacterized protein n=1 Tax=Ramlibacter alkalitolerans TaxID=2039631 RepID=A0ABS1JUB4_9BURK|nr:hypothetical protein [Ramlibacter alkalitolerans]MBL0427848.1 hypothetical protein [Ramlibacter alkalitolerans]
MPDAKTMPAKSTAAKPRTRAKKAPVVATQCYQPAAPVDRNEALIRKLFEEFFGAAFPRQGPTWLRSREGLQLELTGYEELLSVAFQYWDEVPGEHDELRRELCAQAGVALIEVPHGNADDAEDRQTLRTFVRARLQRHFGDAQAQQGLTVRFASALLLKMASCPIARFALG